MYMQPMNPTKARTAASTTDNDFLLITNSTSTYITASTFITASKNKRAMLPHTCGLLDMTVPTSAVARTTALVIDNGFLLIRISTYTFITASQNKRAMLPHTCGLLATIVPTSITARSVLAATDNGFLLIKINTSTFITASQNKRAMLCHDHAPAAASAPTAVAPPQLQPPSQLSTARSRPLHPLCCSRRKHWPATDDCRVGHVAIAVLKVVCSLLLFRIRFFGFEVIFWYGFP